MAVINAYFPFLNRFRLSLSFEIYGLMRHCIRGWRIDGLGSTRLSSTLTSIFPKTIELLSLRLEMPFGGGRCVTQDKGKRAAIKTKNRKKFKLLLILRSSKCQSLFRPVIVVQIIHPASIRFNISTPQRFNHNPVNWRSKCFMTPCT